MASLRFKMVEAAINRKPCPAESPDGRPSEYFGKRVFNRAAMRKYLHKKTYDALIDTMNNGTPLTREIAASCSFFSSRSSAILRSSADLFT